ncbi:extracellular matrix protein 1-like [Synchiropus splendidus]|uniref:extracellular matrix protein 1-like n=1 Tax=Synchiropus splendidus TaxID=270530 RepID=UPI00237DBE4D|nr:extracellular matrix protein 1-like [Synchiropus splendidus]
MGSTVAFCCASAFLILGFGSAAEVHDSVDKYNMEQREVTFDLDEIMQEMQKPDSFMLQKELDLSDLLNAEGDLAVKQPMFMPDRPDVPARCPGCPERAAAPPRGRFGPRSFPPIEDHRVQFPLARPTPDNLQAICQHADYRPNYPESYFPASGFGYLKREADAVNNAESWFRACCKENQTQNEETTLCCAIQAWELSIQSFCEESSSVKDRQYKCCRLRGSARAQCVNRDAVNPNYEPTTELPVDPVPSALEFTFDPDSCGRTLMTQFSVRAHRGQKKTPKSTTKIDITFPPGRPTVESVQSLCENQKLRPRYSVKCLPNTGYEYLARQAKTINRLEKGFKQCCKKKQGSLNCAEKKWRDELNRFCSNKNGPKADFQCCTSGEAADRLECFQKISPDPLYNMTAPTEEVSLASVCVARKMVRKMFFIKSFVNKCCPLSSEEQNGCIIQALEEKSSDICSAKKVLPPAVRRCCRLAPQESLQCISNSLLDAVSKAMNGLGQKKKKICPIS